MTQLSTPTTPTLAETFKEVMDRYEEYRQKWIAVNGDDIEAYNKWFTEQIAHIFPKDKEI